MSNSVDRFESGLGIPQRNKWKVLTGIAHSMSNLELKETLEMLEEKRSERLRRFTEIGAPQSIIDLQDKDYLVREIRLVERLIH